MRDELALIRRFTPVTLALLAVHLIWYLLTEWTGILPLFLPSPIKTYATLWRMLRETEFLLDLSASWARVTAAFFLSFAVAYPLALGSLSFEPLRRSAFFIIELFRYLPVPVFIPLTILWFGVGDVGKIFVVFLGTFVQMVPMYYDSGMLVQRDYASSVAALRWRKWKVLLNITIPGSAPYVLDNSRIAFGWAWAYLLIAELLGAQHGMGYAIIRAQRYLATDKIFAYIIVIAIMGFATDRLFRLLRKVCFPWAA